VSRGQIEEELRWASEQDPEDPFVFFIVAGHLSHAAKMRRLEDKPSAADWRLAGA
jgi:hypothetical protein